MMMEALTTFSSESFAWTLRTGGQASVLIAIILLVRLVAPRKRAMKLYSALWLLLIIRLVTPWAPESGLSVLNLFSISTEPSETATLYPSEATLSSSPELITSVSVSTRMGTSSFEPETAMSYIQVASILWLFGGGVFLAFVILRYARFARRLRVEGEPGDDDMQRLLEECRRIMHVKKQVELRVTDMSPSPALLGFVNPKLLIPRSMLSELSSEEWRCIFLHELAHLKRYDIPLNWLTTCLQALHWFNPLVWYAFYRMRADREIACDALALACAGPNQSTQYAGAIVKLLKVYANPRRLSGVAAILDNKSQLERRMNMIMRFNPSEQRWSLVSAVLLCAVAIVGLTNERTAAVNDVVIQDEPFESSILDKLVNVNFSEMDLRSVVLLLTDRAGLSLVEEAPLDGKNVTANLKDIPLGRALEAILKLHGLGLEVDGQEARIVVATDVGDIDPEVHLHVFKNGRADIEVVVETLKKFFGDEGSFTFDKEQGLIIATATPVAVEKIQSLIVALNEADTATSTEKVERQIRIETMFVQATMKSKGQSGSDWVLETMQEKTRPQSLRAEEKKIGFLDATVDVRRMISKQVDSGTAELLATPMLTTLENQKANVTIGQEIPYQELTQTTDGPPIATTEFITVGTILEVTPQIDKNDAILLELMAEISRVVDLNATGVPTIEKSEIQSTVKLRDGQTVFLTGLRRDETDDGEETELVMFVTCKIVESKPSA